MDVKDPHSVLHEEWVSYHRHCGQMTNSCQNYCWGGSGKPPSGTLAQEAASAADAQSSLYSASRGLPFNQSRDQILCINKISIFTSATEGEGDYVFTPLSVCLSLCLAICRISQKVVDGPGWNLVDRLGVWQRQTDSILVKIHLRIWIRELFII